MKTKLLFSIALLFCFVKSLIAQTFTVGNINYEVTSSITPFTVKITGLVNTAVNSVTIPLTVTNNSTTYNVTAIGDYAFYDCTNLTSVSISDSVTSIGNYAFYNCNKLTSVSIGNSVTSIGSSAFYGCTSLTSVSIGNSVTSIGSAAFYNCNKLTSVSIGNSVTSIGSSAFYGCTSLTSVSIGNSVTSIGNEAFYNCINLTSVTFGNSVTSLGQGAFANCYNLTSFTCLATTPPLLLGTETFAGGWQSNCNLYVPESALSAYRNAAQWNGFKNLNTYLSTTETKNNLLKVYPNPAKDHVVISNISKGENISVYDLSGKMLFQTKSSGNSLNINTSTYKNGLYLVKVGENTTKIIVSK
ncbi:leucine-rich repeat protein [Cloacibacterium normanense]|uniref:leucine-rich repeat domain-containing protein n=1 Tax=Cloacibacterium normanense TaxID=237258 RepID=UPI0035AF4816